jgi:uncharacterized protein YegL
MPEIYDQGPFGAEAARAIRDGEVRKEFMCHAVGVQNANMGTRPQISVRDPLKLRGLAFREQFRWLSNSLSSVSRSGPDDRVALPPPTGPEGWAVSG